MRHVDVHWGPALRRWAALHGSVAFWGLCVLACGSRRETLGTSTVHDAFDAGVHPPSATAALGTASDGSLADNPSTLGGTSMKPGSASGEVGAPTSPGVDTGGTSCGPLISDMEDGYGGVCADSDLRGVWYAFNSDEGVMLPQGEQWPAVAEPGSAIAVSEIPGGRGASRFAMHTYGSNLSYAGVGIDLAYDGSRYATYDAARYAGVTFWARSEQEFLLYVRVGDADHIATDYGGRCEGGAATCYGFTLAVGVGPAWRQIWVPFVELDANVDTKELINVQFEIRQSTFDLWIDDLAFYAGDAGCCETTPDSCRGAIAWGSRVIERAASSVTHDLLQPLRCPDVCFIESLYALGDGTETGTGAGLECMPALRALTVTGAGLTGALDLRFAPGLRAVSLASNLLTQVDVPNGVTTLQLNDNHLTRVPEGLEQFTQLTQLDLRDNQLTQLPPLVALNGITVLPLSGNRLSDVSGVTWPPPLQSLDLSNNLLTDAGLGFDALPEGLTLLALAGNSLHAPSIDSPVLQQLLLNDNPGIQLDAVETPNLWNLDVSRTGLQSVNQLPVIPALHSLEVNGNALTTLAGLEAFPLLTWLEAGDNALVDMSALAAAPALFNLVLSRNRITDLSLAPPCGSLVMLDLDGNGLVTLDGLADCPLLSTLSVRHNALTSLGSILSRGLPNTLRVFGNPLDCAALSSNVLDYERRGGTFDDSDPAALLPDTCPSLP